MLNQPHWIKTPHLAADYRGPAGRPFTRLIDPASAPPIIAILEAITSRQPNSPAIESDTHSLSYAQLLKAIHRLATKIVNSQTVGHVALLLPPKPEYAVALFACLAAGRVSVLLDDNYPTARNAHIASQTNTGLQLISARDNALWPDARTIRVTLELDDENREASEPPAGCRLGLDEPAFILCTSGSSGSPKPIVHSQRSMLHWARSGQDAMHLDAGERALSLSSLSTLGGLTGLLNFNLAGACVQMLDVKRSGLNGLLDTLATRPVTVLRAAPSMLRELACLPRTKSSFSALRIVQTYGEPLMKSDVSAIRAVIEPRCLIRSTYGSTEASGLAWYVGEDDDYDPLRAASGALMPDTWAAIVDADGRSVAHGSSGELWIRSPYNALGEWIDGQLVAGRIAAHPSGDGSSVYRTGDLARYDGKGVFVVLGRVDRMIKINGQRIEPAEIEALLRQAPGVDAAEVLGYGDAPSTKLLAFVVARGGAQGKLVSALRAHLRAKLPAFMVPAHVLLLDSIPLLPGGKVDRLALLAIAERKFFGSKPCSA